MKRGALLAAFTLAGLAGSALYAQERKQAADVDGQIKSACFRYYTATIFGSAPAYFEVTRSPLTVIRNGAISQRTEAESRSLLASMVERNKSRNLSEEDRKQITANLIAMFDDAPVQYVGENTADVTFLVKKGTKPEDGDNLATVVVYRSVNQWRVIAEVTDSAPVPPSYLLEMPKLK